MTTINDIYDAAWSGVVGALDQMASSTHQLMKSDLPQVTGEEVLQVHCSNMMVMVADIARLTITTATGGDDDCTPDELRAFFNAVADRFAKEKGN
jgi:hypothetical protein